MMSQVVAMSEDSPSSLQTVAKHAEHVYSVAEGATPRSWIENASDSSLRTKTAKASSPDQIPPREAPIRGIFTISGQVFTLVCKPREPDAGV
jgi:hypothetical protein